MSAGEQAYTLTFGCYCTSKASQSSFWAPQISCRAVSADAFIVGSLTLGAEMANPTRPKFEERSNVHSAFGVTLKSFLGCNSCILKLLLILLWVIFSKNEIRIWNNWGGDPASNYFPTYLSLRVYYINTMFRPQAIYKIRQSLIELLKCFSIVLPSPVI